MEVLPQEYDLSLMPTLIDTSTVEYEYREYKESNAESALPTQSLYKLICNARDAWSLLSGAYVEVKVKITGAGTEATANLVTGGLKPIPSGEICDIFNTCKFFFDNVEVSNISRIGKARLLSYLVRKSKQHVDSVGQSKGFFRSSVNVGSTGTTIQKSLNPVSLNDPDNPEENLYNLFWSGVATGTATSNSVFFHIPLADLVPMLEQYGKVVRGCEFRLELGRNTNAVEYLVSAAESATPADNNENAVISIDYLSLWVPHPRLSPSASVTINEYLASQGGKIQMKFANAEIFEQTFTFSASAGAMQTARLVANTSRPLSVILGFQALKRYSTTSGDTAHGIRYNSSYFDHVNLDQVMVVVNGKSYPVEPIQLASATRFLRVLDQTHKLGGLLYGKEDSPIVSRSNWKNTYPLVSFDLTALDSSVFSDKNRADIEIRFKLGSSSYDSQTDLVMIARVETERELQIDYSQETKNMKIVVR